FFAQTFYHGTSQAAVADKVGMLSPFSAVFSLPLNVTDDSNPTAAAPSISDLRIFFGYIGWSIVYNTALVLMMMRLFQVRWRVAD
ncbi:MAG TPA: hypothetical protein VHU84_13215, partial [Lacipirellulaceae bacterium]|nr:hypothetical protein [Lacipirellulaceae bacterium]